MFNSFCEVDPGTLSNEYETARFLFNMASNRHWPPLLERIEKESGVRAPAGFGTFLINNHATDSLEDETFDAVLDALRRYEEPHEMVRPADIPQYRPAAKARAARAVYLPREGWANPRARCSRRCLPFSPAAVASSSSTGTAGRCSEGRTASSMRSLRTAIAIDGRLVPVGSRRHVLGDRGTLEPGARDAAHLLWHRL